MFNEKEYWKKEKRREELEAKKDRENIKQNEKEREETYLERKRKLDDAWDKMMADKAFKQNPVLNTSYNQENESTLLSPFKTNAYARTNIGFNRTIEKDDNEPVEIAVKIESEKPSFSKVFLVLLLLLFMLFIIKPELLENIFN